MGMVRIAFYFEYENFLTKIAPAFTSLKDGNSNELRLLAKDVAKNNPKVWRILEYYYACPADEYDFEEKISEDKDERIVDWLVLIMSNYCSIFDDPANPKTLRQLGVNEEAITLLIKGRPFSSIFLLLDQIPSKATSTDDILRDIDDYPAGWLSVEDIKSIEVNLQSHREGNGDPAYETILKNLDTAIKSNRGLILGLSI